MADPNEGREAYNPKTGQTLVMRGGRMVLKVAPSGSEPPRRAPRAGEATTIAKYMQGSLDGSIAAQKALRTLDEFDGLNGRVRPRGGLINRGILATQQMLGNADLDRMDQLTKQFSKEARTPGEGATSNFEAQMQLAMSGGRDRPYRTNVDYANKARKTANLIIARHRFTDRYLKRNLTLDGADSAFAKWERGGFVDPGKPKLPKAKPSSNAGWSVVE